DVRRNASGHIDAVTAIRHQATLVDMIPPLVDRWQPVLRRQLDDPRSLTVQVRTRHDKEGTGPPREHAREGPLVIIVPDFGHHQGEAEGCRRALHFPQLVLVVGFTVGEDSDPGGARDRFLEQLELLTGETSLRHDHPGDVSPGPRKAANEYLVDLDAAE